MPVDVLQLHDFGHQPGGLVAEPLILSLGPCSFKERTVKPSSEGHEANEEDATSNEGDVAEDGGWTRDRYRRKAQTKSRHTPPNWQARTPINATRNAPGTETMRTNGTSAAP